MSGICITNRPVRRPSEQGTTLLEIVITMAIMTVGMLGFFLLHIQAFKTSSAASTLGQATNVAMAVQDMLQSIPYTPETQYTAFPPCEVDAPSNSVEDFGCHTLEPVNTMGTADDSQAKVKFYRSWHSDILEGDSTVRIRVRVRYPSEDGRCPTCTDPELQQGWRAVTTTSFRTITAY